jgi:hypothetical protein
VAGFCEHDNEPERSVEKAGYCLTKSDYQFLKEYPAPWGN